MAIDITVFWAKSMLTDPLPYLDTFAQAAEHNSFTAAAATLGLSQAAVSQRIAALEKTLGLGLFHRQGGHVLLTQAGKKLHAFAERIQALHQQARQELTGLKTTLAGDLSLAASSIPGEYFLPGLLSHFHKLYPEVQVRATIADSHAVLKQVEQGQVHLGLVGGKSDCVHLDYRCFACDQMVLVIPAQHPWSRRKQVSLEELANQPLILREEGSGSRWCLEQALNRLGKFTRDMDIAMELGSNEAIKEAVARGLGLAVLSKHAVQKEIRQRQLRALRVDGLMLDRQMYLVWDKRRALPRTAQLFLSFVEPCAKARKPSANPPKATKEPP